ncbi:DUF1104 domain-containing protein [Helicobacter jaachi]|uniref:DUF1104 domain-containing protein n=1 Tax=Helicobacter jaachi TaxID=1677920 RepID=A0A4U8TD35_9HELI|nr:DUF1104 domain-containing protein [Helicobacter jaachi]TLD97763.1 DUF1104 domain-containing protein [Helicobacter jaachi]
MKYLGVKVCVIAALFCGVGVNAADFSKKSDDDLVKLSGVVKVEEFVDYELEVAKRLKAKSEKDAQAFKEKLKTQFEKATENLTVKQLREYRKATREAMQKHIEKMSAKELKESGLHARGCKDCKKDKEGKDKEKSCQCGSHKDAKK